MTKEEFFHYMKEKLASMEFRSRRRCYYKIIDDDYLVGFSMDGSTFCKGFSITCGGIYLPDDLKIPFRGVYDVQKDFVFPLGPEDPRSIYECIEDLSKRYSHKNNIFEYELYTIEKLDAFFDANYKYVVAPIFDKNYGLERFRANWKTMNGFSAKTVVKLCERADLNVEEVLKYLGKTR